MWWHRTAREPNSGGATHCTIVGRLLRAKSRRSAALPACLKGSRGENLLIRYNSLAYFPNVERIRASLCARRR